MPIELKTDRNLLARLNDATKRGVTKDELHAQRVSFVFGNLPKDSPMTKHDVERALDRLNGQPA